MKDCSPEPLWPFVAIVVGLFVLMALSTRPWQSESDVGDWRRDRVEASHRRQPERAALLRQQRTARRAVQPIEAGSNAMERLEAFAVPPRPAATSPPVADRVRTGEITDPAAASLIPPGPLQRVSSSPQPAEVAGLDGEADTAANLRLERTADSHAEVPVGWPYPAALAAALEKLEGSERCQAWAGEILTALGVLCGIASLADENAVGILDDLAQLADQAEEIAKDQASAPLRAEVRRVGCCLQRRVVIWQGVHRIAARSTMPISAPRASSEQWLQTVLAVERFLDQSPRRRLWKKHLGVTQVRKLLESGDQGDVTERIRLAHRLLSRMDSEQLASEQRQFLSTKVLADYRAILKAWAEQPVDYVQLLNQLEAYEQDSSSDVAQRLAQDYHSLRWSDSKDVVQLAEDLDTYYRNANARLAISGQLINRLVPNPRMVSEYVDDEILGARVGGLSRTLTRLRVVLLPDRWRWRMGLEAQGEVASETWSSKGPVTFYSDGETTYRARKLLLIDRWGIRLKRAEAEAQAASQLTGVETNFDAVPLLGMLTRAIAIQQHDTQIYDAHWEVEDKVAYRASQRLDHEVQRRIANAEKDFRGNVLEPLKQLELDPVAIDMHTTPQRIIARYRLAGVEQLAANTARPRAPADSVLSIQLHESAFNNTLEQLELDGKRTELRQLCQDLGDMFGEQTVSVPEDLPDGVVVQFADQDAIRIRCDEGHVQLTLRLAELSSPRGGPWHDFEVSVWYRPQIDRLDASLVRDGIIEIRGDYLSFRDRFPLRGIFSKVFAKSRPVRLISKRLAEQPKLRDLGVSQFVVDGGWVGVALGPTRSNQPARVAGDRQDGNR